ncbi:MAG: hypothetical protein FWC89_04815 [Defluviitaleaceae bacterium]|nr:hypothetical protein [Defluviitaleaceae bacterium]
MKTSRTFGWVQDPNNFRSLCNVVAVFDYESSKHRELVDVIIPSLVLTKDGQSELVAVMHKRPLRITYRNLVGTSFTPRSSARCNGIIQATVKGQKGRAFIGDWPADNYVRWAHCFGFIKYNYDDDTFEITDFGRKLTAVYNNEEALSSVEIEILTKAILAYPPAIRVLSLLSVDDVVLTKFEIGKQLGFIGEGGFGSMPQNLLIRELAMETNAKKRNEMKADWEGASDKYARMTAGWLAKLGLVRQVSKTVSVEQNGKTYSETIGQSYTITAKGLTALNRAMGKSRHPKTPKNICFEMLATKKHKDREYLRTRRALIIKHIYSSKKPVSIDEIIAGLEVKNINASPEVIRDDIAGLINIGLFIEDTPKGFVNKDAIVDFVIPVMSNVTASDIEKSKDEMRENIKHISHEYLSLMELAYDSKQNRFFEMKTLELLTEECGYSGMHLGGSRKPDGIIYTENLQSNFGIIVDTKAYSKGYSLSASEADKMQRYVEENKMRDEQVNPNKWWENFGNAQAFYFMFVSGHFTGKYKEQLNRITLVTKTKGAAVAIKELLLIADRIKENNSFQEMERMFFA